MTKALILLFHPDLSRSKTNAALTAAAGKLHGVEVTDMHALYPTGMDMFRDGEREAARLRCADRIALQFPIQWYSTPPLVKAWQDAVLTRMFYLAYDTEGRLLEGTPLMLAATAGNLPEAYRPGGRNMFTMIDLLAPPRATAHRCGLSWGEPFVLYHADITLARCARIRGRRLHLGARRLDRGHAGFLQRGGVGHGKGVRLKRIEMRRQAGL